MFSIPRYIRTSVARTLIACLSSAISNLFWSLTKTNPVAAGIIIFGIISGDFHFDSDNGMSCVLIRIASMMRI